MQAASLLDGLSFDGFPPFKYGWCSAKVDVSRRRLFRQFDDLELLGCRVPHEASSPSPRTLFLSRRFSIKTSASVSLSWRASALSTKASGNLNAAPAFAAEGLNLLELNVAFDLKRETNPAERHCCFGREPLVALEFALRQGLPHHFLDLALGCHT